MEGTTHILLIDDDQVDRAAIRRALTSSGLDHELVEASNGAIGLDLSSRQTFDCVLLDYRLPDIDAFDVLHGLLSSDQGNHAVLILTGEADQNVAFRLMRAGALDYLSKAEVTPSSLARAIRYARARRDFLSLLEEKSRALDTLNRQKTLLFSLIAHDLRNPFQAILGLSEVLSRSVSGRDIDAIRQRAEGVHQAARQAHSLMESLFTWASLQMDTLDVELSDVDLHQIASEALRWVAPAAAEKSLSLHSNCADVLVRANPDMLLAVLRNLVSNAVKFTYAGGAITISAAQLSRGVEISVIDTGVGISPAFVENLFQLDRKNTTVGTAGEPGSGLGLLLCHDLVERQGGTLKVESEVDKGTNFFFILPSPR